MLVAAALVAFALLAPPRGGVAQEGGSGAPATMAPSMSAEAAAPEPSLEGSWVLALSTSRAEEIRDAGVARAADALAMIVRPIARRRLRGSMPIHGRIDISSSGNRLRTKIGPYDVNFPADNSRHPYTDPWGEDLRFRHQLQGRRLRQVYDGDGGDLLHTLTVNASGERLTLDVRIRSDQLPVDASYRVPYRRR